MHGVPRRATKCMVPKGFNQGGFLAWEDQPEHGSQDSRVNQASYEGQVNQSMVPRSFTQRMVPI